MKLLLIAVLLLSNAFGKNLLSDPYLKETDVNDREINEEEELEIVIEDYSIIYSFTITNENYFYCFSSDTENIFYKNRDYDQIPNESFFKKDDIIYVNPKGPTHDKINIKITPYPIYKELNSFQTINQNQYFFIRAEEESMAYFDSFDRNSSIYISEEFNKTILNNDTRINGKFYPINKDMIYMIKNRIYSDYSVSNFKQYVYPTALNTGDVNVNNNEINFIYLKK